MKLYLKCAAVVLCASLFVGSSLSIISSAKVTNDSTTFSVEETKRIVDASSMKTSVVVDEISHLEKIMSYTEEELYKMGCTEEEVAEIRDYDYNKVLYELSELDAVVLSDRGYSEEQVESLKKYNGIEDAFSYIETYSLSNASLTLNMTPWLINTTNQFNLLWYSSWSSAPIFQGTDIVAFVWEAATKSSAHLAMKFRETPSVTINYYYVDTYISTESTNGKGGIGNAEFKIPMSKAVSSLNTYAKEVAGNVIFC